MANKFTKLILILLILFCLLAAPWQGTLVKGANPLKKIRGALSKQINQVEADWYDLSWIYRLPIEITNPCGEALTDFQVQLTLDSAFDFGHARSDGADILITAEDGVAPIPFWVETWNAVGQSASIWVKVPDISILGTTIFLYYGNANPPPVPTVEAPPTGPWEKPIDNPIVPIGDPNSGADLLAENIVYDAETGHYWMAFDIDRGDSEVGLIWSDDPADPTAWQWHGSVITDANTPHLIESDSTWYIFYADRGHGGPPSKISVATSSVISGTYTYYNTVLTATEDWEADGLHEPYVFQHRDGSWIMLYMGDAGSTTQRVGYAEADDILGPYTKYSSNPVINFGSSGYYDAGLAAGPWAIEFDGVYYLGYTASESITSPRQTAYVTTTDWATFTRRGIVLPVAPTGEWDSANSFGGAITRFGDTYFYSYTGGNHQMGIATQPALKAINDPDLVFEFHDSFEGSNLSTEWQLNEQSSGGTFTVDSDVLTLTGQSSGISGTIQIWGNPLIGTNTILETYARHLDAGLGTTSANTAAEIGYKTTDFNNLIRIMDFPDLDDYTIQATANGTGSGEVTTAIPYDTSWHTYRVFRTDPITGTVQFQVDGSSLVTLGPPNVPIAGLRPWLMSYAQDPATESRFVIDWVRVRKWCGAEIAASPLDEEIVVDLEISKTDSPDPVFVGEPLAYTIVVTNTGIVTATSVIMTDTLPTDVDLASTSTSQGTCNGTNPVICDLGELFYNSPVTVTLMVTPTLHGSLENFAEVQTSLDEPELANNNITITTTVEPHADLTVIKVDDPDPVYIGNLLTYAITVTNDGPSTAINTTLTETLPTNTNLVSAIPSQGSCSLTSPVVCNLLSIPSGANVQVDVSLIPTVTGVITNQVDVVSSIFDPNDTNNTASESTTVNPAADLAMSMTDDPDPVYVGELLTYTIMVTNNGPSTALNVTLTDTLPANTDLISATPSQGSCSLTSPVVCDLLDIPSSGSATVNILLTPTVMGVITNQASVVSSYHDPDEGNNTATELTTVIREADLSVSMVDDPDPVFAGDPLTYNISIVNGGPNTAISAILTDTLPANTNLISATPSQGSCSGTSLVVCDLLDIPGGSSVTVDLLVIPTIEGLITNQVEVTSSTDDPDDLNNTASEPTTVDPVADLSVSKEDYPDAIFVDNDVTYTVTVQNTGPSTAMGVIMTDTLPSDATHVSTTPSQGSCSGTDPIVCSLNDLASGEQATIIIVVTANAVGTMVNEAMVSSSTHDPNLGNNFTTESTIVADAIVDLKILGTDTPDPVVAGEILTYRFDISNQGPSNASSVTFTDTLSSDVSFISSDASQGECSILVCELGPMNIGGSAAVTVVVSVDASALGMVTNSAIVTSPEPDQNTSNNSVVVDTTVNTLADLRITKTDDPDPVVAGEMLNYTIIVYNDGSSDASSVTVTDTLPAGVTFVSSEPGTPVCEVSGNTVECNLGTISAGNSSQIVIAVFVSPSYSNSSLTNQAQVTSTTFDPDTSNNTAEAVTSVNALADLEITITDDPDPVTAGEPLTYTIRFSNFGPSDATNVRLVSILPNGVLFSESSPGSPTCSDLNNTVVCDFDNIDVGININITIVASVTLSTVGNVTNQVTISSDTTDPTPNNNSAEEETLVVPPLPPDTEPPVVTWVAPVGHNQRYDVGGEVVQLVVGATDNVSVARVYFYRWDAVNEVFVDIGNVYSPPYRWDFDTSSLNPDWNQIIAEAYDTSGNKSERGWIWLYLENRIYLPLIVQR